MPNLTMSEAVVVAADKNFVTSLEQLDDFGLTSIQFRVYCRLLRLSKDGIACESAENIAKACKLTRVTVMRVLVQLEKMNLIERERAPGKKSILYLMPSSNWQHLSPEENKVVQFPATETCKSDLQVNDVNTQQQESTQTPLKGGLLDSPAEEPINESNTSTSLAGTLQDKLDAARARGWQSSGTWWNDLGQQMVTVNCFVVSVAEFMQRSLDSFEVGRQVCETGLAMARKQIEKIKQRSQEQKLQRLRSLVYL
jgi:DNA-binding transcriptional regulator GbsR (MarR family)